MTSKRARAVHQRAVKCLGAAADTFLAHVLSLLNNARPLPPRFARHLGKKARMDKSGIAQHIAGEVGLLAEEGCQRLLSVFADTALACLQQISDMTKGHPPQKFEMLYGLGLDLVATWDREVILEEASRMEGMYPEVSALHCFSYLWLLDRLFSDRDLKGLSGVPPLPEAFAGFMRRVARHHDVRRGRYFLECSCTQRRAVFGEAFRGAYHDLVQVTCRAQCAAAARMQHASIPGVDAGVSPDEAASQVSQKELFKPDMLQSVTSRNAPPSQQPSVTPAQDSHVKGESGNHPPREPNEYNASDVMPGTSVASRRTKAITISGPCFFAANNREYAAKDAPAPDTS